MYRMTESIQYVHLYEHKTQGIYCIYFDQTITQTTACYTEQYPASRLYASNFFHAQLSWA